MNLYKKIDDNGLFVEDVLLDAIPFLTETITETIVEQQVHTEYDTVVVNTVTETVTMEDGTAQEITYDVTEQVPREVITEVQKEVSHEEVVMQNVLNEGGEVIGQEPVVNPYYIETECPQGFYKPKWDGVQWMEGLTQAEIDNIINNQVIIPTIEERVTTTENKVVTIEETLDTVFGGTV